MEFGWPGDDGLGERLVQQIIDGTKTATCGFKRAYTDEELSEVFGSVGRLQGARSYQGPIRCIIRVLEAFETPFGDPDPRLVAGEGDGDDVAKFQRDHVIAWKSDFPDSEPGPDEPLVVELFELVSVV